MLEYFIGRCKLDRGLVLKFSLKVMLGIPYSLTKDIEHFGFIRGEMVIINAEFSLYLDPLIFKSRVYPVR